MKNIFLSTIVLLAFSISIIIFQISCTKEAQANTNQNSSATQLNKLIYTVGYLTYGEIWLSDYNGNNKQKINISLPSDFQISSDMGAKLSPDGNTVFFSAWQPSTDKSSIFFVK